MRSATPCGSATAYSSAAFVSSLAIVYGTSASADVECSGTQHAHQRFTNDAISAIEVIVHDEFVHRASLHVRKQGKLSRRIISNPFTSSSSPCPLRTFCRSTASCRAATMTVHLLKFKSVGFRYHRVDHYRQLFSASRRFVNVGNAVQA